jgi:hypothetical protein
MTAVARWHSRRRTAPQTLPPARQSPRQASTHLILAAVSVVDPNVKEPTGRRSTVRGAWQGARHGAGCWGSPCPRSRATPAARARSPTYTVVPRGRPCRWGPPHCTSWARPSASYSHRAPLSDRRKNDAGPNRSGRLHRADRAGAGAARGPSATRQLSAEPPLKAADAQTPRVWALPAAAQKSSWTMYHYWASEEVPDAIVKYETGSRWVRDSACLRPPRRRGST